MTFPILIKTYVSAVAEAQEQSVKTDVPVYLFRQTEGYVIDILPDVYSDEKLIMKFFKGERQ